MANYNPGFLADEIVNSGGVLKAAAIRKDYSRMRKIAQERLKRFEGTEWVSSETYRYNKNRFKRLDEIKTAAELAHLTAEVQRFLESPRGSVSGLKKQRAETIAQMHEHGYTWINAQNYQQFTQFMDALRSAGIARLFDSERIGEMLNDYKLSHSGSYDEMVSGEELATDFTRWVNREIKRGNASKIRSMSAEDLRKEFAKYENRGTTPHRNSGGNRKR